MLMVVNVKCSIISLSLTGHKHPVCDLASEGNTLVSSDEQGNIIVWSQTDAGIRQREFLTGSGYVRQNLHLMYRAVTKVFWEARTSSMTDKYRGQLTIWSGNKWIDVMNLLPLYFVRWSLDLLKTAYLFHLLIMMFR